MSCAAPGAARPTVTGMADADEELETHIRGFLTALNERLPRDKVLRQRMKAIRRPDRTDAEDRRRYAEETQAALTESLGDMYERIEMHGSAIALRTADREITTRVNKLLKLTREERADAQHLHAASSEITPDQSRADQLRALAGPIFRGVVRGLPRQRKIERATTDLSAYCLLRFPFKG